MFSNHRIKTIEWEMKNRKKIIKHFDKINNQIRKRLQKYTMLTKHLYDLK